MGIASLVLGIVSIIIAFVPCMGSVAFVPAIVGLILGIVDLVAKTKGKEPKGMQIAGVILNSAAIIFIIFWIFVFSAGVASTTTNEINNILQNSIGK